MLDSMRKRRWVGGGKGKNPEEFRAEGMGG
jgi:hypothetical protein